MLIESYVVSFSEVKRCIANLQLDDFVVVSENIFSLSDKPFAKLKDLLFDSTPVNHPAALILINKQYAQNLLFNGDNFEFLKRSHSIGNMDGVSLHLSFVNSDLVNDAIAFSTKKLIDGIYVRAISHQSLLAIQQVQRKRHQANQAALRKAIEIYARTDSFN